MNFKIFIEKWVLPTILWHHRTSSNGLIFFIRFLKKKKEFEKEKFLQLWIWAKRTEDGVEEESWLQLPVEHQGGRWWLLQSPPRELSKQHRAISENRPRWAQNGNLGKLTAHAKATDALNSLSLSLHFPLLAHDQNPQNTGSYVLKWLKTSSSLGNLNSLWKQSRCAGPSGRWRVLRRAVVLLRLGFLYF